MRPWRSLQGRLLLLLLGGLAIVWLGAVAWTARDVRHELDELLDAHLAQAAALLVVQQAGEIEHDDERTLDAPALHRYAPRAVFQVFHQGQLVLRSADAPRRALVEVAGMPLNGLATVTVDGAAWRVFFTRGGEHDVQVLVAERVASRAAIVRAALRGTLVPLAVALPVLALLVWAAIRRGLAPLRALGAQLAARDAHALGPLALADAPAEIEPLQSALNALLARIDELLQAERRFTADAAHELRTPIAAVRAQAQVALAEADAGARRHALLQTLEGCDRATRVVEQLLTLSRLEAGAEVPMQAVDLVALARQVVGELAPRALARGQDLGVETVDAADGPGASWAVRGDATLLGILLRNLVDNALRYSPRGTRINVAVRPLPAAPGEGLELTVEDGGPGLDEAARVRLGQRFRRDPGQPESGSGLGWSIVRRIAEVHGLSIVVDRSPGLGGLRVRVGATVSTA